ncbi:MAG: hypothetical protein HY815_12550 [Candidatus Riflebacteria bacterium]|nr:hypothetical protein [Candidatus Riflebacteria bacterium]
MAERPFWPYFAAAFSRSCFTNLSLIFVNSSLVAAFGGRSYSSLYFWATVGSIAVYLLFMLASPRTVARGYFFIAGVAFALSLAFWRVPGNAVVLYAFGASILLLELVGPSVVTTLLQRGARPAVFKQIFGQIVTLELAARVVSAGLMWALSAGGLLRLVPWTGWALLSAHLVAFVTIARTGRADPPTEPAVRPAGPGTAMLADTVRFVASNPLMRAALMIMVWTHVAKFLVEYLFYQAAGLRFRTLAEVGSFVSTLGFAIVPASLALQKVLAERVIARRPLSFLLGILPVGTVTLGAASLVLSPFWCVVALMLFFQCINRSVQLPVSRQCLVPAPGRHQQSITFLASMVMSVAGLLVSGGLSLVPSSWGLGEITVVLLVGSTPVFFVLTQLDSLYVRNLWGIYREKRYGTWDGLAWTDTSIGDLPSTGTALPGTRAPTAMSSASDDPLDPGRAVRENRLDAPGLAALRATLTADDADPDRVAGLIRDAYRFSTQREVLTAVVTAHKRLLVSPRPSLARAGLRVLFEAGSSRFAPSIARFGLTRCEELGRYVRHATSIVTEMASWPLGGLTAATRRRCRLLVDELRTAGREADLAKLGCLASSSGPGRTGDVIDALFLFRNDPVQGAILLGVGPAGRPFSIVPVLDEAARRPYLDALRYRRALRLLGLERFAPEVHDWVRRSLSRLIQEGFSAWGGPDPGRSDSAAGSTDLLGLTVLSEAWCLVGRDASRTAAEAILDLASLSLAEKEIVVEINLEQLKQSRFFDAFSFLLEEPGRRASRRSADSCLACVGDPA